QPVDHRADLFSLGSVLYALCTGQAPFRASGALAVLRHVCEELPRPIWAISPDIPDWLGDLIARLHAKDPAARFSSAKAVAEILGQHLAHLQQPNQVPRPAPVWRAAAPPQAAWLRLPRWPVALIAGGLLLLLGVSTLPLGRVLSWWGAGQSREPAGAA